MMLSMKVNELQQQLAEANNKIRRKLESPRKNRRREEPARQVQSPIKRSKVSEFDIDDPTKCNTQCSVCWTRDCVRIANQLRHSSATPITPTSFSWHPLWTTMTRCIDGDSPTIPVFRKHHSVGAHSPKSVLFPPRSSWFSSKNHPNSAMNDICDSTWYLEIMKHKGSPDKYKSEDCSVLEALKEIICSKKGDMEYHPSSVEFFSCIMSTLAGSGEHCRSVIHLPFELCFSSSICSNSCFPTFRTT